MGSTQLRLTGLYKAVSTWYRNSVVRELPNDVTVNEVFQALADPTRRAIIRLLRSGDHTAGEIAKAFPLAKSTLSGHFNVLKRAGLIVAERQGTTIMYSLNVSAFEEVVVAVMDLLDVGTVKKGRHHNARDLEN